MGFVCAVGLVAWFLPRLVMHPISELNPIPAIPTLLAITAGFLYGAWCVMRSLLERRWRCAAALIAALAATSLGLVYGARALMHLNTLHVQERIAEEVLGSSDLEPPISFYEFDFCISVDLCTLAIFELPASLEQRFRSPHVYHPDHRPRAPGPWGPQNVLGWTATPSPDDYRRYLDYVLAQDLPTAQTLPYAHEIGRMTARPGSYLSLLYETRSYRPTELTSVQLFVIDLELRRILLAQRHWQR